MIMAIISAQPLAVENDDYMFIGTVSSGRDRGKNSYINTRWTRENSDVIFDGEDFENTIAILQKEVLTTENLFDCLACWYDEACILTLNPEEVHDFNEFYKLTKEPEMLSLITEDEYATGITLAEMVLINELDTFMNMSRRSIGGRK